MENKVLEKSEEIEEGKSYCFDCGRELTHPDEIKYELCFDCIYRCAEYRGIRDEIEGYETSEITEFDPPECDLWD